MKKTHVSISISLIILTLFCIVNIQIQAEEPLWNNWRVLAVDASVAEQTVLSELRNKGVREIISQSTVKKQMYANDTVQGIYNTQFSDLLNKSGQSYSNAVSKYFSDKDKTHNLFYIKNNAQQLQLAQSAVENLDATWGMDEKKETSIIPSIIAFIFFLLICLYSKRRILFIALASPYVLLLFKVQLVEICASSVIAMFIIFLLQEHSNKNGFFSYCKKNVFFLFLVLSAVLISLFAGFLSLVLFICASICSFSIFYVYTFIIKIFTLKRAFVPLTMRPIRKSDFVKARLFRLSILLVAILLSVQFFYIFSKQFSPASGIDGLSVPAPIKNTITSSFDLKDYSIAKEYKDNSIPTLIDYIKFAWNSASFPYTNMFKDKHLPVADEEVFFPRYVYSDGKITKTNELVLTFNADFLDSLLNKIRKAEPSIETVLYDQGGYFAVNYTDELKKSVSANSSLLFFVIGILSVFILVLFKANKWLR